MNDPITYFAKTTSDGLDARSLLERSPVELLGVSAAAAGELEKLGIQTVFDLAASSVFAIARRIALPLMEDAWREGERLPGDFIDNEWRTADREALALRPIEALRAIGPALGQSLAAALGITNLREMALWPPYVAAREIFSRAHGLGAAAADPEAPPELVPGSRPYPTERVQYEILVLDELDGPSPAAPQTGSIASPLRAKAVVSRGGGKKVGGQALGEVIEPQGTPLETAGPLDLSVATAAASGFTRPAFGAVLTYTQTWFPEGLALGQLLHTLALAPGESTRLAMVDWSRRSSASTSEDIAERDALGADMERGRSIGEIVNAVATEAQQGFSESFGIGAGTQVGTASGGAGSADLSSVTGLPVKVAGGSGESTGMGIGVGYARSSAWTTGQRNLSANMAQNILDRTHQASTMARNRRATIVREVSQAESERVSTRTVTNYNHMHALSIEYFEVVQLYRVMVDLTRVSAALFVPMKLIDFNAPGVIQRHRRVIVANGLTPQVRALELAEPDSLLIAAPEKTGNWVASDVAWLAAMFGEPVGEPGAYALGLPLNFYPMHLTFEEQVPIESFLLEMANGTVVTLPVTTATNLQFVHAAVLVDRYGPTLDKAAPFWDVVAIRAKLKADTANWSGPVTIFLRLGALQRDGFPNPQSGMTASLVRVTIDIPAAASMVTVFEMTKTVSARALRQHLMDNQLYYSQRIWQSIDSTTVAQLLSGYTFGGRPVLSDVDPLPLTVAGNFLVFRKHEPADATAQQQWAQWLASKDIRPGERQTDLVPLPSGGVFAEAVLGRFNSAEKLDITRFWNWQDSPIPITPPEIAAIQTGSRARDEGLMPGQMQPSTLNIQLPPDLPEPEGLQAILQAIQNGAMFRDMSGLNSTIGFAQSAMTRAFDAARDAASQAGENMKTAADIYKSAFGGGGGGDASAGAAPNPSARTTRNPSEAGALINHAQDMDRRGIPPPDDGAVSDPSEWAGWPGDEPPLTPPPLVQAPTNEGRVVHGPPKASPQTPAAPIDTQIAIQAVVNRDGTDTREPLGLLLQMDFWRSVFNASGEAVNATEELAFTTSARIISNNAVVATRSFRANDVLSLRPRVYVDPTLIAYSADRVVKALFGTVAGWPTMETLRRQIYALLGSNVEVEVPNTFAQPIFPSGNRLKLKLAFNLRTDSGVEASFNLANQLGLKYDQNGTLKFDTGDLSKLAATLAGMASRTPVGAGLSALLSLLSFQGSVSNTLSLDSQGTSNASLKIKPTTLESVSVEQVT